MKKAKGIVLWADDKVVKYKCECGKELLIDEEKEPNGKCENCDRIYGLYQMNLVFEIKEE